MLKIKNKKIFNLFSILLLVFVGVFFIFNFVLANFQPVEGTFLTVMGYLAKLVVYICGILITKIISLIHSIAGYNKFSSEPDIIMGWRTVRDLCNMFFVLIFLVIAFATILRIESYQLKKTLPKLIIMAILINFSKTICALMIDFSQVIMLTFVNAFSGTGGEFVAALSIQEYLSMQIKDIDFFTKEDLSTTDTLGSYILAILFMIISLIVLIAVLVAFLMRMIMFWVYIVLSPLAFLLSAFPQGAKYASQYWGEFTKYLINGPVLAFFTWLALVTANNLSSDSFSILPDKCTTEILCIPNLITYVISIGFLVGGLVVSQQIGGIGSSWGAGVVRNMGATAGAWAKKGALLPVKLAGKGIGTGIGYGVDKLHQKTGVDLNLARSWKTLQAKREENRAKRYTDGQIAAGQAMEEGGRLHGWLAMTGASGDAYDQLSTWKGFKKRLKGGKKMAEEREKLEPSLNQAKFEKTFTEMTKEDQREELEKLTRKSYEVDDALSGETDEEKIKELKKEKKAISNKLDFAVDEEATTRSDADKEARVEELDGKLQEKQEEFDKNVAEYGFEYRAAECKAIANEKDKIKNVDDAAELVKMMRDAMRAKDKSKVKAIMQKMTADANDNEAFQEFTGESGYEGLQTLMDQLSDKEHKNYAGFSQQEAYTLGAQVAEMNKSTNHWEASAAYTMENGRWRKSTRDEHVEVASNEMGKMSPKALMSKINRLGLGKHVMKDGEKKFELTDIGVMTMQNWDNERIIDRLGENMTESTAKFLTNSGVLDELVNKGLISGDWTDKDRGKLGLAAAIRERAGEAAQYDKQSKEVKEFLDEAYKRN